MKALIPILCVLLGCGGAGGGGEQQEPSPQWELAWVEDFEAPLDQAKWYLQNPWREGRERVRYDPANVIVEEDYLYLTATRRDDLGPEWIASSGYVRVTEPQLYGRFSVRVWLHAGADLEQTVWLCCGGKELGIFEAWLNKPGAEAQITFGEYVHNQSEPYYGDVHTFTVPEPIAGQWHTFTLEWTPTTICRYYDNELLSCVDNELFHTPLYLTLEQCGVWQSALNVADLPQEMVVDWVRVEKWKE